MVTAAEWDHCVAAGGCRAGGSENRQDEPIAVTHTDARAYARWLSSITGRKYRLPSEAQWEHLIRAEKTTPYWWGQTMQDRPKSRFENWWYVKTDGLEWVEDCWHPRNLGVPTNGQARTSTECTRFGVRGSKDSSASTLRSAHRSSAPPDTAGIGFRVVSTLD